MKSQTQQLNIELFRPKETKATDGNLINVKKAYISFGMTAASKLNIKDGDYVLIGHFGTDIYFAKRPAVGLAGFKVSKQKKAHRLYTTSQEIQRQFFDKQFELGERIEAFAQTTDGKKVAVEWYKGVAR